MNNKVTKLSDLEEDMIVKLADDRLLTVTKYKDISALVNKERKLVIYLKRYAEDMRIDITDPKNRIIDKPEKYDIVKVYTKDRKLVFTRQDTREEIATLNYTISTLVNTNIRQEKKIDELTEENDKLKAACKSISEQFIKAKQALLLVEQQKKEMLDGFVASVMIDNDRN